MGWGELSWAGQGKHRLFRTVERKTTKGCIHYEQIDKMRQDLIRFLLTSLELRKRERKGIRRSFNAFRNIIRLVSC